MLGSREETGERATEKAEKQEQKEEQQKDVVAGCIDNGVTDW